MQLKAIYSDLKETCEGIPQRLNKVGFAHGLQKIYCIEGLENVFNVLIAVLKIFQQHSYNVQEWLSITTSQRDLIQATQIFPFTLKAVKNFSLSHALQAINALFMTTAFIEKYELYQFERWHRFSESIGKTAVFQNPFLKRSLNSPKDFFRTLVNFDILIRRVIDYNRSMNTAGYTLEDLQHLTEEEKNSKIRKKKRYDLVDSAYRIVLLVSIQLKSHFPSQKYSSIGINSLEVGSYSLNLLKFLIKS